MLGSSQTGTGQSLHSPLPGSDPYSTEPLEQAEVSEEIWEVVKIVRLRRRDGRDQYLVKWSGHEMKDNTWEPIEHLSPGAEEILAELYNSIQSAEPRDETATKETSLST